jgi:2-dehydropantoate 2-reductase
VFKILVLGAGATGGYFGGRLAQAEQQQQLQQQTRRSEFQVSFLVRPQRAELLRAMGLRVESAQGNFTIPVRAVVHTELKPEYDLVLLSCKAYDLESSILSIYPGMRPNTYVLPLLNGLAHFDRLDKEFGAHRTLGGCCAIAGTLTAEGVVRQLTDLQRITYGLRPGNDAGAAAILDQLDAAYQSTPVDVRHSDDVLTEIWEKYLMLAALAGMTCLMRAPVGDIVATDDGQALMLRMLDECLSAARHAGKPPRPQALEATRSMLTMKGSNFTASMLRDLESGNRTESDHIIGDMLMRARAAGNDATLLQSALVHLKARDSRLARETGAR